MTEEELRESPNTLHVTITVGYDGDMTVSKGWHFDEQMPDDVVAKCQMLIDGIILAIEFDAEDLMKKAAYGIMWSDMKDQEKALHDAEQLPEGENIVSLARRKLQ